MKTQTKTRTPSLGLVFIALTVLAFAGVHTAYAQQIVTNVAAPSGLSLCAVNPALNKLYFASGNPAAEQIVVVDGVTFSQTGVGYGQGVDVDVTNNNYWSAGVYSDSVTVWSSSNTALASPATGSGCAMGVSVDAPHRRVWVGAQCSDSIWVFNADTYARVAGPISPGGVMGSPLVNPATGRAYLNASGSSKRVNPSTFAVTANAFGTVIGANASANLLYAASSSTTLQIINGAPDPEVVLTNISLPFSFGSRIGVNPVLNRIYVGYSSTNIVAVLNATTGQGLGNVSLGAGITSVGDIVVDASRNRVYAYASGGGSARLFVIQDTAAQVLTNVAAPSGLDLCAVNPALNKLYFASGNPAAEQMVVVDGVTFSQTGVGYGQGVDVDVANNNYWSAGVYSDSVTVWNSSNTALASAATGSGCAVGVTVDAPHRRVWVGAQCTDSIWAFNADTHALVAGPISPGGVMGSPLVNPATDRVYFNAGGSKRVNPSTFAVTANAFGSVIGANASANLLYAVNSTTLQIINGAPDPEVVLTNVTLPFTFGSRIGVNPVLNRIYLGYNSANIVAILNATTGQSIENVYLGAGITSVGSIVVDASRSRVYALAYGGGSYRLIVIQDTAAQVLTNIVVSPANSIIGAGSNQQFTATGHYSDGSSLVLTNGGAGPLWSSSSPTVASTDANGLAAGLTDGATTITATFGSVSGIATLTVVSPPAISIQPTNNTVSPNGSVTFNVGATGGALGYQWQFNGTNILGANGASLTIPDVSSATVGVYSVIVNNAAGSVTSSFVTLASVDVKMFAGIIVNGPLGSNYLIQASSNLTSGNWTTLTNVALPAQPYIYIDYTSCTNSPQFYRAVPQ